MIVKRRPKYEGRWFHTGLQERKSITNIQLIEFYSCLSWSTHNWRSVPSFAHLSTWILCSYLLWMPRSMLGNVLFFSDWICGSVPSCFKNKDTLLRSNTLAWNFSLEMFIMFLYANSLSASVCVSWDSLTSSIQWSEIKPRCLWLEIG